MEASSRPGMRTWDDCSAPWQGGCLFTAPHPLLESSSLRLEHVPRKAWEMLPYQNELNPHLPVLLEFSWSWVNWVEVGLPLLQLVLFRINITLIPVLSLRLLCRCGGKLKLTDSSILLFPEDDHSMPCFSAELIIHNSSHTLACFLNHYFHLPIL